MWHRLGPLRLVLFLLAAIAGCGPSFQAVYECDVRFEHCYAMDEESVPADAKKECWHTWLHAYTYGQSRDRVEYAAARFSQLSLGPSLPSEDASDGGTVLTAVAAPVPTNAFAPPPNVAATPSATAPSAGDAGMRAPGAECSDSCKQHWNTCRDGCDATASTTRLKQSLKTRSCDECDRGYRACVPACFRDGATSANPAAHTLR